LQLWAEWVWNTNTKCTRTSRIVDFSLMRPLRQNRTDANAMQCNPRDYLAKFTNPYKTQSQTTLPRRIIDALRPSTWIGRVLADDDPE